LLAILWLGQDGQQAGVQSSWFCEHCARGRPAGAGDRPPQRREPSSAGVRRGARGPPVTPSPKPPGRIRCPTGWAPIPGASPSSQGYPRSWCGCGCRRLSRPAMRPIYRRNTGTGMARLSRPPMQANNTFELGLSLFNTRSPHHPGARCSTRGYTPRPRLHR
jgi:hypothetical protein